MCKYRYSYYCQCSHQELVLFEACEATKEGSTTQAPLACEAPEQGRNHQGCDGRAQDKPEQFLPDSPTSTLSPLSSVGLINPRLSFADQHHHNLTLSEASQECSESILPSARSIHQMANANKMHRSTKGRTYRSTVTRNSVNHASQQ